MRQSPGKSTKINHSPLQHSTDSQLVRSAKKAHPYVQSTSPGFETEDVLGVPVALVDKPEFLSLIQTSLEGRRKGWITGITGHALNLAYTLPWMKEFYHRAICNCPEGFGVVLAAFLSGVEIPRRIIWHTWIYELLHMFEKNDYSLFLLGSTDEVGKKAIEKIHTLYPKLRIAGHRNGYDDLTHPDDVLEAIERTKPDVVFVALGMPLQEDWIYRNIDKLDVKLVFPVGALIEYVSEIKKRCPRWMSSLGLEWMYRLLTDTGKVWQRYILGNPLLVWRSIAYRTKRVHRMASL